LTPPTWQSVSAHEYEPWDAPVFTLDTAEITAAQAVDMILTRVSTL
jgi:hypothetical protein